MVDLQGHYFGRARPLFWLYMRTALLTLVTFGIYRFWAKTRIRKYIWSATAAGEDSFEYTGTGLEKFLGFLVAIVILAVFLGILNMLLMFAGLNVVGLLDGTGGDLLQIAVLSTNLLALGPLMLFAVYRARRYKLARTRWRGLRFGMENGALGYVARALGYYALALLSLGILLPLATFRLEAYMIDRTWYGDAKLSQGGTWSALYPGLKHVAFAAALMIAGPLVASALDAPFLRLLSLGAGYVWLLGGLIYYRVYTFNYMMRHRVLDGAVTFGANARIGHVISIYIAGVLALIGASIAGAIVLSLLGLAAGSVIAADPAILRDPMLIFGGSSAGIGFVIALIVFIAGYVGFVLALGGVNLVMITQKVIEHVATAVSVENAAHLDQIRQRSADDGADAEGFADALDIGGSI